jgi:hypothetical protein
MKACLKLFKEYSGYRPGKKRVIPRWLTGSNRSHLTLPRGKREALSLENGSILEYDYTLHPD